HPLPVQLDGLHGAPVVTAAVIGRQLRVSAYQGEIRREVVLEDILACDLIVLNEGSAISIMLARLADETGQLLRMRMRVGGF
ncbi:hypothetical protein, partial [Acinetobacter schindleri]|uniref:hypothetical protein n=1 Tax=Acinetobacter schindleri TaxID=108981 RepID=UPI0030FC4C12